MKDLLVEDYQPRRTRQQDLLEGGEQREAHVLIVHESEALDHVHQLIRVGLHPMKYWVQALVLRAIHHWTSSLSIQENFIFIDSPVGPFSFIYSIILEETHVSAFNGFFQFTLSLTLRFVL